MKEGRLAVRYRCVKASGGTSIYAYEHVNPKEKRKNKLTNKIILISFRDFYKFLDEFKYPLSSRLNTYMANHYCNNVDFENYQ